MQHKPYLTPESDVYAASTAMYLFITTLRIWYFLLDIFIALKKAEVFHFVHALKP